MAFKWYAVQTYAGQESRVVQYVQEFIDQGDLVGIIGSVISPSQEVVQVKNGKKVITNRRFLPSYVLVEMEMGKEAMHFVQNVNGVQGFVGGLSPKPLKDAEVERMLGRESDSLETPLSEAPYQIGDAVKVNFGPFKGFDGNIDELVPEKGKAKVMVTVFGRSTPVEVDFSQIEPIS